MTTWSYEAFVSDRPGRAGITELEQRVTNKLEELGLRAQYAKVAMSNIVDGAARAVVYYPDAVISLPLLQRLSGWSKGDVNLKADFADDTERCKEEMYEGIAALLSSLSDAQAATSEIAATARRDGYATVTIWYPAKAE